LDEVENRYKLSESYMMNKRSIHRDITDCFRQIDLGFFGRSGLWVGVKGPFLNQQQGLLEWPWKFGITKKKLKVLTVLIK